MKISEKEFEQITDMLNDFLVLNPHDPENEWACGFSSGVVAVADELGAIIEDATQKKFTSKLFMELVREGAKT